MASSENLICPELALYKKGKVREVYDFGDKLLIVASDRISAFDVVLPSLITDKGKLLTKISNFWFDFFKNDIKNHLISSDLADYPKECHPYADQIKDRSVLVHKTEMIEMEAIVRGYLSGSGLKEYKETGSVCGIRLPEGLQEASKLEVPIFTPSTKAQEGHDMNVPEEVLKKQLGNRVVDEIREKSLFLYKKAADYALKRGIIIADTKFEFGMLDGKIILIDEILTPDSSRFWPAVDYQPGVSQRSYDKQYIRNYLETLDWDKKYPGPELPSEVIENTRIKYQDAMKKLCE